MDWNVMVQYLPQYEKAAWLTLRLGVAGIFWAILVGLVCAVLQYEKVPVLRRIVGAYAWSIVPLYASLTETAMGWSENASACAAMEST